MGRSDDFDPARMLDGVEHADPQSVERLFGFLYDELRRLAAAQLQHERPDHTLQPTELVNEAWMKLADVTKFDHDPEAARRQFMAIAARAMRQILVDHARGHGRLKRSGQRITLQPDAADIEVDSHTLIDLSEAIDELQRGDDRIAKVVEMRLFGGLNLEEIAAVLGVSRSTVKLDWSFGRATLSSRLRDASN